MDESFSDQELRELHRLIQQAALTGYPNPDRAGCPGQKILEEVAGALIASAHPAYQHIKHCSPCLKEMLDLRGRYLEAQQAASVKQKRQLMSVIAACLLVTFLIGFLVFRLEKRAYTQAELAAAPMRIVNLWDVGTLRGDQPNNLSAVSLPASLVRVTVILPRLSELGQYTIAVTKDTTGKSLLAEGKASAVAEGSQALVRVVLDLRKTKGGLYFLSTTREQDQASYYYPLQVGR